ncbi:radical SAM protein [Prolixibacteraceae bacterium JC049]|nr:radical SAM protein [Prolixibacteraceae bacterium JC049]
MKVYLIKASSGSEYSKYKAETGGPPQNIFSAAAATPEYIDIEMTDETIGMKTNFRSKADVVAIFMSTPDALRAYEIADKFRAKGKAVVLGGLHTHFMQDEAKTHADSLLIGEVEEIWEELLNDFQNGTLKVKYQRKTPFDLAKLKPYPTHLIPVSKYNYTWSVVVSRGCPFKCDFCLVHQFFPKYQLRSIDTIVDEVKALKRLGVEWVELHSDNLTQDRTYAIKLFEALAPLKMNFYGETTILIAKDEELLAAAKKAGLKALLFGIETPSEEALKGQGKAFVKPKEIKEYVKTVKSYGIEVWGDFLFGFDEHDSEIFQETLDFVKLINVDRVFPHLMIPFPGSDTYKRLESEGRILTKDWSKYDGGYAVYQPGKLTPEDLEAGLYWFWEKQTSIWEALKNTFKWK